MAKSTRNTGKRWSAGDSKALRSLAKGNTPTRVIGLKLGRSEAAVRSKAGALGVSLKPTNQSRVRTPLKRRPSEPSGTPGGHRRGLVAGVPELMSTR
jgi:hypothetical protein